MITRLPHPIAIFCGSNSRDVGRLRNSYFPALVLFALICVLGAACTHNYNRNEIEAALRKLAVQTPPYPGFQLIDNRIVFKDTKVNLFFTYRSEASLTDVKAYYNDLLSKSGWGPPDVQGPSLFVSREGYSKYRRGEYTITVVQDDGEPRAFDIIFEWNPK